jgi:hypothetical protein
MQPSKLYHTTLFIFKLYLSNKLFDIADLINFINMPPKNILLISTKILTGLTTDEEANTFVASLKLSEIDFNDDLQNTIIRETLINFDQILKISTINVWSARTEQLKQSTAATNLQSKIQALEIKHATESTALALYCATENINNTHLANQNNNLRITNLKKSFKKYEQKNNELQNKNKKHKTQKNYPGSHTTEPVASPEMLAPMKHAPPILDLTGDNPTEKYTTQ